MRIFGADSFSGPETAINEIPSNYLEDGDLCIVNITDFQPNMVYYYRLDIDSGQPQSIPNVIAPKDGLTGNKRWILMNIRADKLIANEVLSNTYNPHLSGGPMILLDNLFILDDDMVNINGQLNISTSGANPSGSYPPIITNSTDMVENLNVERLGGLTSRDYVQNNHRNIQIPYMSEDMFVTFQEPLPSINYTVWVTIKNIIDPDPSIYGIMVIDQTVTGFGVRFSGDIDSDNYFLNYLLIGDVGV